MLSEINQRDRGKYYTISLICGINKKKNIERVDWCCHGQRGERNQ